MPNPSVNPDSIAIKQEWDDYWQGSASRTYSVLAEVYRKLILRGQVRHFLGKYFVSGSKILHAGCGSGQVDAYVADKFKITALDISGRALSIYRTQQQGNKCLIQGNIFSLPVAESTYDGIYNLGVMEHFTEDEIHSILVEFHRILKPGGRIVLFWPPSFGVTVRLFSGIHWLLDKAGKSEIRLHPPELTHIRTREQAEHYLTTAGFSPAGFHFGWRDLFIQVVIAGNKVAA